MTKTLPRRLAALALAATAAVGGSTFFANPASAHDSLAGGVAKCDEATGDWVITWTLKNDMAKVVNLTNVVLEPDDPKAQKPTSIPAKDAGQQWKSITFTSVAPSTSKTAVLKYTATWPYNNTVRQVTSSKVDYPKEPCVKPTPSRPTESKPSASASVPPSLPLTGSSTTVPMLGVGAGLVVGGAVVLMVLRRRRRVQFTAE